MGEELGRVGTGREMVEAAGRRWLRAVEDAKGVVEEAGIPWGKFLSLVKAVDWKEAIKGPADNIGIDIDDIPWDELVPVLQELFANCPTE